LATVNLVPLILRYIYGENHKNAEKYHTGPDNGCSMGAEYHIDFTMHFFAQFALEDFVQWLYNNLTGCGLIRSKE